MTRSCQISATPLHSHAVCPMPPLSRNPGCCMQSLDQCNICHNCCGQMCVYFVCSGGSLFPHPTIPSPLLARPQMAQRFLQATKPPSR
ncbi:hypothetical protein IF2G_06993 [Cordyceps javanica]|nr:hypothetical protein IF2G_06993 [Cordyceps javanica]